MTSLAATDRDISLGDTEMATPSGPLGSVVPTRTTAGGRPRGSHAVFGCLFVLLIAGFNCFYRLSEPAHPFWDESYYLTATARYELGAAQFASHPPLGLMLIAGGDRLSGLNRGIAWQSMARKKKVAGEDVPAAFSFAGVRLAPALLGTLAAGLFFILMLAIGLQPGRALFLTTPFLFDTALIAQFRAAQLDSFQICFMLAALVALVRMLRTERLGWMLFFGVSCGLATMVRANAILLTVATLWPIGLGLRSIRTAPVRSLTRGIERGAVALAGFLLAVGFVFSIHVMLSRSPLPAGSPAMAADAPFIEPAYAGYIDGETRLTPSVIWAAADGYRGFMAADMAGIGMGDPNGSSPWNWPLGRGSIVYRWDSDGVSTSYVALVPNVAGWCLSLAGIIGSLVMVIREAGPWRRRRGFASPISNSLLLALWITMMVSNVVLAQHRVMYIYHYFMPLVLGWTMAGLLVNRLLEKVPERAVDRALGGIAGLVLANFLLLSPLALHRPLGPQECARRSWGLGLQCRLGPIGLRGARGPEERIST